MVRAVRMENPDLPFWYLPARGRQMSLIRLAHPAKAANLLIRFALRKAVIWRCNHSLFLKG
jgi:hypothetical protein